MNKPSAKKGKAISDRIAKHAGAFTNGQLRKHSAVSTFKIGDAAGQRGWGPLMQT